MLSTSFKFSSSEGLAFSPCWIEIAHFQMVISSEHKSTNFDLKKREKKAEMVSFIDEAQLSQLCCNLTDLETVHHWKKIVSVIKMCKGNTISCHKLILIC